MLHLLILTVIIGPDVIVRRLVRVELEVGRLHLPSHLGRALSEERGQQEQQGLQGEPHFAMELIITLVARSKSERRSGRQNI